MASLLGVRKPILVLSGTRSPRYLQAAAGRLAALLPYNRRVVLANLDHSEPWNAGRGGQPSQIAPALISFFLDSSAGSRPVSA